MGVREGEAMEDEITLSELVQAEEETPQENAEETVDAGAEEAGEEAEPQANENEGEQEPEEPKKKRPGGWQRTIHKQAQQIETLLQMVQKQNAPTPTPTKSADPAELANLGAFIAAHPEIATYDAAEEAYKEALKKHWESERQKTEVQKQRETVVSSFGDRIQALPDLKDIATAIRSSQMSSRLLDFMQQQLAPLKNGEDVLREAVMNEDFRDQLIELDRVSDGEGIKAELHAISAGLRIAKRNQAAQEEEQPRPKPPKPPTPTGKNPTKTSKSIYDEDLSYREYVKLREAQLKG